MCRYECMGSIVLILQDIGDKIRSRRRQAGKRSELLTRT